MALFISDHFERVRQHFGRLPSADQSFLGDFKVACRQTRQTYVASAWTCSYRTCAQAEGEILCTNGSRATQRDSGHFG